MAYVQQPDDAAVTRLRGRGYNVGKVIHYDGPYVWGPYYQ